MIASKLHLQTNYSYSFVNFIFKVSKMVIGERFELEKDEELRVEVELQNSEEHVFVELQTGIAEIFGTEMVIGTKYQFNHGAKFSVFTYHGCSLTVYGQNKGN